MGGIPEVLMAGVISGQAGDFRWSCGSGYCDKEGEVTEGSWASFERGQAVCRQAAYLEF